MSGSIRNVWSTPRAGCSAPGLFDDVRLLRDGDVLVVQVVELPTITGIEISGNKAIQTDMLLDGLKQSGLAEGLVFKRSTLERIALELERPVCVTGPLRCPHYHRRGTSAAQPGSTGYSGGRRAASPVLNTSIFWVMKRSATTSC